MAVATNLTKQAVLLLLPSGSTVISKWLLPKASVTITAPQATGVYVLKLVNDGFIKVV